MCQLGLSEGQGALVAPHCMVFGGWGRQWADLLGLQQSLTVLLKNVLG